MSDFSVPVGYRQYSQMQHQTAFVGPNHTAQAPEMLIFDRVPPKDGNADGRQTYKVRFIKGTPTETNPLLRDVVEVNIRTSRQTVAATAASYLALVGSILSNADFANDAVVEQLLPRA